MKRAFSFLIAGLFLLASCNKPNLHVKLKNDVDSISYLIGLTVGKNMKQSELEKVNPEAFARAISEVYGKDSLKITDEEIQRKLQMYFMNIQKKAGEKNSKENADFFAKNKAVSGVITLPSGLQYQVVKEGTGAIPDSASTVSVTYTGKLLNGETFDSNVGGSPAKFPVTGVIPGWTEALLKMKVGSQWKVFIPSELGYGERGGPRGSKIKPNAALIFDVELLGIEAKAPEAVVAKGKKK